jgi:catechol-2,3-dioxygenase
MTPDRGFTVRALGEVVMRCLDIESMEAFYRDVIGLKRLPGAHRPDIAFFGVGYGGHTAVHALFQDDGQDGAARAGSSLHHVALTLDRAEQGRAAAWLRWRGLECRVEEFRWIGWRGLFTRDPEGNTVELVAYDGDLLEAGGCGGEPE